MMDMALKIMRRSRGASILFPLEPMLDESIRGYLSRVADWNCFTNKTTLLRNAGLTSIHRDLSDRIKAEVSAVSDLLGITGASLQRILRPTVGGDPEVVDYFGLPFQRRRFEFTARRVSPASLSRSPHHRARWEIRLLPFCAESWEYLIDQCPSPECGKPLRWNDCRQIGRCGQCEFDLTQARPMKVPLDLREVLEFVGDLVHPTPEINARALARLAPPFSEVASHDIFEVLWALTRSLTPEPVEVAANAQLATTYLSVAAQVLLDYPVTIDRIAWEGVGLTDPRILPLFLRLKRRGVEKSGIQKALILSLVDRAESAHYGPSRVPKLREEDGEWTFDRAASWLGISHSQLRKAVAAGLARPSPLRPGGRHVGWIQPSEVHSIGIGLRQQMTPAEFTQTYDLPLSAMEQLVSLGLIEPCTEPIVKLLYPGLHLDRVSVLGFVERIAEVLAPPLPDSVALEDVFHGIGGREKPWGAVLTAALDGHIPGGLGVEADAHLRFQRLTIPRQFAWELLAGRYPDFLTIPARRRVLGPRADFSRLETQRYLNCFPRDLTWLLAEGHLSTDTNGRTIRCRDVERLGRGLISSREISWRWRVSPGMRESLPAEHGISRALGPFWPRQAVEERFAEFFGRSSRPP